MIKNWLRNAISDDILKRLVRNLAYLFSANMLVALLGLLALTVMARSLGPTGLGIVALIEAYARSVDRVFRFESWQTLVRFGAAALEDGRDWEFRRLVKFSTLFDLFGASVAAIVSVVGLTVAAPWFGFDENQKSLAIMFSAILLFSLSSTPTAVLRLFDKFDLIAQLSVILAVSRLVLTVLAWQLSGEVWSFVFILMVYYIVEQITPLVFAWRELRRRNLHDVWGLPFDGLLQENRALPAFLWNVNINVIARSSTQRFDTLILGAFLGPAAVGLFQLAKRTGLAALRLGRPLQQAVYPDVARLWARGEILRFRRIVLRVNTVMGVLGLLAFVLVSLSMEFLVRLAFGDAFVAAAPLVIVQVLAVTIFLAGNTFGPAMMSMGEDRILVCITLSATIAFFVGFVPLVLMFGAMGASLSHLIFNMIWLLGCLVIFLHRTSVAYRAPPKDDNQNDDDFALS